MDDMVEVVFSPSRDLGDRVCQMGSLADDQRPF